MTNKLSNEEQKRYSRHIILPEIGIEGQEKLKAAKVLVVGCGGLGCPVLQYLTAAGIGTIGVVDFDIVSESNLQRQILFTPEDVGKPKVMVAKEKLSKQNPFITINTYPIKIKSSNALEIIKNYNIVVDGCDNFSTRYLLSDSCVMLDKPLVSGSIFKFEGQVTVFNFKNGPTYRCLYPEPPQPGEMPTCSDIGVIGVIPGIIGMFQVNETIKIITHIGEVLNGKLLTVDALTLQFNLFSFELIPQNKIITHLNDYNFSCSRNSIKEITSDELKQMILKNEPIQLIDVREKQENEIKNIGGELIPLNVLPDNLNRIAKDKPVIIYCQIGARGRKATQYLQQNGFTNVYNLSNGLIDF